MATVVETVERDGVRVMIYDNGMEQNADTGKLLRGPKDTIITTENSTVFHRARREIKYQRAQAGANRALTALRNKKYDGKKWVDDGPVWENPQDLDYVEAIAEAQAAQALLVGDPSSTKAANWVMTHTGQAEVHEAETNITNNTIIINGSDAIAQAWQDALSIQDADVIDIRNENGESVE